jgi:hypothetical protein
MTDRGDRPGPQGEEVDGGGERRGGGKGKGPRGGKLLDEFDAGIPSPKLTPKCLLCVCEYRIYIKSIYR